MTWNYRIVRHKTPVGEWYGLHEVYYDSDGNVNSMTAGPITFDCDVIEGPEGIIGSLEMALADARKHPVLETSDETDTI